MLKWLRTKHRLHVKFLGFWFDTLTREFLCDSPVNCHSIQVHVNIIVSCIMFQWQKMFFDCSLSISRKGAVIQQRSLREQKSIMCCLTTFPNLFLPCVDLQICRLCCITIYLVKIDIRISQPEILGGSFNPHNSFVVTTEMSWKLPWD